MDHLWFSLLQLDWAYGRPYWLLSLTMVRGPKIERRFVAKLQTDLQIYIEILRKRVATNGQGGDEETGATKKREMVQV